MFNANALSPLTVVRYGGPGAVAPAVDSPNPGTYLAAVETVTFEASWEDDGLTTEEVYWYVDGTLVATDSSPNLEDATATGTIPEALAGARSVTAKRLTTEAGLSAASAGVSITVSLATLRQHAYLASGAFTPPSVIVWNGVRGSYRKRCWGAGGGGDQAVGSGGGGAFSETISTATGEQTVTIPSGGAAGGGNPSGDTSIGSDCIAKSGLGRTAGGTGGTAAGGTGDTKYNGGDGAAGAGTVAAGAGAGSGGAASTSTPGEPDGGKGHQVYGNGGASTASSESPGAPGHAQITYWTEATAGYPRWVGATNGRDVSTVSTRNVTIPSGLVAGDILVMRVATYTDASASATGWTERANAVQGTQIRIQVFERVYDAADPVEIATSASVRVVWIVRAYRNAAAIGSDATATNGSSTNADPPSLDAGTSAARRWTACAGWHANTEVGISALPSGYDNALVIPSVGTGPVCVVCDRLATTQTENPGACTSTTEQWGAATDGIEAA